MKQDIQLHPAQIAILRALLFQPEARFSELNSTNLSNDHFTFHIQQLIKAGLIEKGASQKYILTVTGKEFTNRFDTDDPSAVKVEKQAKLGVAICCVRTQNGTTQYLLQQRLKQPYYGYWGCMTGKIRWGESVYETAQRELKEEMGLEANLALCAIKHKTDFSEEGMLLEDKFFFYFRGNLVQGELIKSFEGGTNQWLTRKEIEALPLVFHDLSETLQIIDETSFMFEERKYRVNGY